MHKVERFGRKTASSVSYTSLRQQAQQFEGSTTWFYRAGIKIQQGQSFLPENIHDFYAAGVATGDVGWEGLGDIVKCLVTLIPEERVLRRSRSTACSF